MRRIDCIAGILLAAGMAVACGGSPAAPSQQNPAYETSTVTDLEGNVYRTVRIGTQWWMAQNLRATRDSNGTALQGVYALNDVEGNVAIYGRLYTWDAALRPIIPGWHLPSSTEWTTLITTVGAGNAGTLLMQGGSSGFAAVPGGSRYYDGTYVAAGSWGQYWTSSVYTVDHAYTVTFRPNQAQVERTGFGFTGGVSVRLVRDN